MAALRCRALQVVVGTGVFLVGQQRNLGVHDQVPVLGQVDHHVGLGTRSVVALVVFLHVVFHAPAQTGEFQHALQDQLAPVALRLGRALSACVRFLASSLSTWFSPMSWCTCWLRAERCLPSAS
jgi:hypothetical protein